MIIKSLIAGTVLSVMAGSVVYYGTDIDLPSSAALQEPANTQQFSDEKLAGEQLHPHESSEKPRGAGGKAFKPREKTDAAKAETPNSEKWADEYVKSDTDETARDKAREARKEARREAHKEARELRKLKAEEKRAAAPAPSTKPAAEHDDAALMDDAKAEIDTMMANMLPKHSAMKEAKGEKAHAEKKHEDAMVAKDGTLACNHAKPFAKDHTKAHSKPHAKTPHAKTMAHKKARKSARSCSPAQVAATIELITQQAQKIEMPELRDRAYLDLVSYALKHKDYDSARTAIQGINQIELRDTARNRMAIAYAKHGQADAAFEVLEELEVSALSDVIRLQVIEAIISPEPLSVGHK